MAKRKKTDHSPTAVNMDLPVFIPNEKGETTPAIGTARLRYGTLVVEFKDTAPAIAIQRMIERGVLMGLGMIMVQPDSVNEAYQEVVENEELKKELKERLAADDKARSDDADL